MSIGDFIMKVTSTRRSPRVVRMNMTGPIMRSQEPKMKMRGSEVMNGDWRGERYYCGVCMSGLLSVPLRWASTTSNPAAQ